MGKTVSVAMAGFDTAKSPDTLVTSGIGSCIAVFLHDRTNKIGGLAHIMLPRSKGEGEAASGKYADTAIDALIRLMERNGALHNGLTAKIAGGSSMFAAIRQTAAITVGKDNIESVKQLLADRNIRIAAGDTGGSYGRAVACDPETGAFEVTILTKPPARIVL